MTDKGLGAFDLVIFDWAGTMVDFGCRAPVAALLEAFARRGVVLDEAAARADMGKAKADHVRAILARPEVAAIWLAANSTPPGEDDVAGLMTDLGPLMRQAAAEAAELIPGAAETVAALRAAGLKVASSTGYTREMMEPVLARAAAQGYAPDHLVCAGETPEGRPSPLMIYKACVDLGVWPLSRVIKVDDAEAGIAEGRAAGCFTVGVAASGNGVGLTRAEFEALSLADRTARLSVSSAQLRAAGADVVVETVSDLLGSTQQARLRRGEVEADRRPLASQRFKLRSIKPVAAHTPAPSSSTAGRSRGRPCRHSIPGSHSARPRDAGARSTRVQHPQQAGQCVRGPGVAPISTNRGRAAAFVRTAL